MNIFSLAIPQIIVFVQIQPQYPSEIFPGGAMSAATLRVRNSHRTPGNLTCFPIALVSLSQARFNLKVRAEPCQMPLI